MRHLRWIFVGLLAGPVLADKPQRPSLEMLEYLGSLVESDEGLIGPEDFDETDDAKQQKQQKQQKRSEKEEENDE